MPIPTLFPPDRQEHLYRDVAAQITARRNRNPVRHRTYQRVVKRARHNSFRVKRASDIGIRHDGPAVIELANQTFIATNNQKPQVKALISTG